MPMLGGLLAAEFAIHATCADALAVAVLQKLRTRNRGLSRTRQIDIKAIAFFHAAVLVPRLNPIELAAFQRLFAVCIQLAREFFIDLVQIGVGLLVNLVEAIQTIKIIAWLVAN